MKLGAFSTSNKVKNHCSRVKPVLLKSFFASDRILKVIIDLPSMINYVPSDHKVKIQRSREQARSLTSAGRPHPPTSLSKSLKSPVEPEMAPLCPEGSFYSEKMKTAEDTRVNQAEGMRLRHKGGHGDEWLTLISALVSTAGGAQRHCGGWPGFTPVTARSLGVSGS